MSAAFMRLATVVIAAALVCGCSKKRDEKPSAEQPKDAAPARAAPPPKPISWVVPSVKLEVHAVATKQRDLDVNAFAQRLGDGLRASEFFVADERETPQGRSFEGASVAGRLSYDVVSGAETPSVIVALEVAVLPHNPTDYLPVSDNVIVERVMAADEGAKEIDKAIEARSLGAIDTAIDGLIAKERLRAAPADELGKAIKGPPDIAVWALDLIADRREVTLVDAVAQQLRSREAQVVESAITTLVALGEPSAVGPLTKLADFQDYERLRVLIEATSALGGDDAAEFLEFVATGHPDDDVKAHAKEALGRLRP